MAGTSLLGAGDVADIKQIRRDGIETSFAIADPPVSITLYRTDPETGVETPDSGTAVVITFDRRSGYMSDDGRESGGEAPITGRMKAREGWDARRGDRFVLADGSSGRLEVVQARGGAVRATFSLDIGR